MSELRWRDAVRGDLPRLQELWAEQQALFREKAPTVRSQMPELFYPEEEAHHAFYPFKPPILRVRVCEENGMVTSFLIVEAVLEVQVIGGTQASIRSLGRELPEECQWARAHGFRSGWGLAPKEFSKPIERGLRHTPLRAWPNLVLIGCDFSDLGD